MKKMMPNLFVFLVTATLFAGCATRGSEGPQDIDLIALSYSATEQLLAQGSSQLPREGVIVVSTLVNANEQDQSASFGRIVSNQIASGFSNKGYRIKTMELPVELFIKEESGLVYLSEEARNTLRDLNAAALVVGIYAAGRNTAYVSTRIMDVATENVISTTDFAVPMGPDAKVLLRPNPAASSK